MAVCGIFYLLATDAVQAAQSGPTRRVLLISTGNRFSPGFTLADQAVLEALGKIPSAQIETYGENLDILQFPPERFARIFKEYLKEKYAEKRPDLVMLIYVGNVAVAGKLLEELFPGTPVIVAGFTEEEIPPNQFGSMVSGIAQRVDTHAAIELILRLQPETRRIVVIGGTADVDRHVMDRAKMAARDFVERVHFEFWDDRNMAQLRQAVTALPPHTVILFGRMFRDGDGQPLISSQVARSIVQWANAPVYVMTDPSLGTGAVGGAVASVDAFGKRAGELARLILTGTAPALLPFEIRTDTVPLFDWRALKRWGISESSLPTNSVVRFRPQSFWEQYQWYIISAIIIIAVESAFIVTLLLERRHRRRAEAERKRMEGELQRNRDELAHVTRVATVGELTTSIAHELNQPLGAILSNAEAAEMFLTADPPALDEVRDILADIRTDDRRASEVIQRVRGLLRKQELAPKSVDVNEALEDVLKLLSIDAAARKVTLTFELQPVLPRVWCDPVHFQQVVLNLVINGMDAVAPLAEEKRRIAVRTGAGGNGTVEIAVADLGPGIPANILPNLFAPFFSTKKNGLGMGLAIARSIVEAHQGQIWVENNSGAGATFCFTLPVSKEPSA